MKKLSFLSVLLFLLLSIVSIAQQRVPITVDASNPQFPVQEKMWGLFFEDINFAADGGLNAELIKNGSFEFYRPTMGWQQVKLDDGDGRWLVINREQTNSNNPRSLILTSTKAEGRYGIVNEGFRGMGIKEGVTYHFSAHIKSESNVSLDLELLNSENEVIGQATLELNPEQTEKYTATLVATETVEKGSFRILIRGEAAVEFDLVSLFPSDTWKNQPNGFRADIMQMLKELQPGFFRFPGGCIVEGHELATRYQWKKTIGPREERKLMTSRWSFEMRNRQAPDYFQSFDLGFYEYFIISKELGAEPMPILNAGMACQYNTGEVVPLDQLQPYIDDVIDLIEFANGDESTKWGAKRASMGHPEPFNLKMVGIGNEQWGPQFVERYKVIAEAVRAKHPEIKLISGSGPSPDGDRFEYLWEENKKIPHLVDFVDEHFYRNPDWFLSGAARYDSYDRNGPKVFPGEYACHGPHGDESESRNTWLSAMAEAAFMTGMERNADVVQMAAYAPLLAHVDAWQWRPDLIWFNNLTIIGSPNYYVQKLFAVNKGTDVIPILRGGQPLTGLDSLYASATIDKVKNQVIIKIVNASKVAVDADFSINGGRGVASTASIEKMASSDLMVFNSISNPKAIAPVSETARVQRGKISIKLDAQSFYLITVNARGL